MHTGPRESLPRPYLPEVLFGSLASFWNCRSIEQKLIVVTSYRYAVLERSLLRTGRSTMNRVDKAYAIMHLLPVYTPTS